MLARCDTIPEHHLAVHAGAEGVPVLTAISRDVAASDQDRGRVLVDYTVCVAQLRSRRDIANDRLLLLDLRVFGRLVVRVGLLRDRVEHVLSFLLV